MINDEMCLAPFKCRALTGECCNIFFENGRIFCSLRGCTDTKRQSDVTQNQGFSLQDIFGTTLVTSLTYNVLTSIGATTTITTTTTTIATTTSTAPTFTLSMCQNLVDILLSLGTFQLLVLLVHFTQ